MDGFKEVFSSLYNGSNGEDMAGQFNDDSLPDVYNSSSFCGSSSESGNCGSQNGASADSQIVSFLCAKDRGFGCGELQD